MVPVRGVRFDRNIRPRFSPPRHTLPTSLLPIAQRCIGHHYPTSLTLPTLHHPESCRTCQKRKGSFHSVRRRGKRGLCTVKRRARGRIGRDIRRSIRGHGLGASRATIPTCSLFHCLQDELHHLKMHKAVATSTIIQFLSFIRMHGYYIS